ncbi:hypothetical protein JAAARDRAFT_49318 [Jaapia argillacea MUCL 33604]|uniref:Uncharacterized protein n=1 Tax=Jaapia argillacea MUCL 33604 TaxID=933084 RepID=A0A067PVD4_9AGAM|nr:hypothetical protein JAAARDRAFT_49318 [Jaapia argillacea MUCL 33604]
MLIIIVSDLWEPPTKLSRDSSYALAQSLAQCSRLWTLPSHPRTTQTSPPRQHDGGGLRPNLKHTPLSLRRRVIGDLIFPLRLASIQNVGLLDQDADNLTFGSAGTLACDEKSSGDPIFQSGWRISLKYPVDKDADNLTSDVREPPTKLPPDSFYVLAQNQAQWGPYFHVYRKSRRALRCKRDGGGLRPNLKYTSVNLLFLLGDQLSL